MRSDFVAVIVAVVLPLGAAGSAMADAQWIGGGGDELWSNGANWDTGFAPASATERGEGDVNVARNSLNGSNILIQDGDDLQAFAIQIGYEIPGTGGREIGSNTITMTGGSLTTQGGWLFNVGRGRNQDPNQLVQFNMSGGTVNAAGITIPEAYATDGILGFTSTGINAEMHVSGDAVVNTDLLRLGARDANSRMSISGNAQVNLTDDNNGFAPGALWIEAFESEVIGTSLLDIRDNGVLTVHGEWWTDENEDGNRGAATQSEADYIRDNYVANGWIVGNGVANNVNVAYANGVVTITAIPEPTSAVLLLLSCPLFLARRRS